MDDRDPYGLPRRRGVGGPLAWVLLAFLCGVAVVAVAVHRWDRVASLLHPAPPVPLTSPPVQPPVASAAPSSAPVSSAADPALSHQVDVLDERVDALDTRTQQVSSEADRAEGLLVAFAARRMIDRGQPLGYLEGLLHQHFGNENGSAVAMVIGGAQHPVTLLQLQNGFAALAPALVSPGPSESWWSGVRREVASLFVVRKVETPSVEPSEQQARAIRALSQGTVEEAMAEALRMPGAARASAWVASARRYVLVHNALDRIEAAALLKRPEAAQPAEITAP